jgi:hypothetical protein
MPTVYSLGKAKIVGMASVSGAAGVNNRRSAAKAEVVTGFLTSEAIFYLSLILSPTIMRLKIKVKPLARITGKALR